MHVYSDKVVYLRFGAVHGTWRRCTETPRAHGSLDTRFHPRRWIMLPEVFAAHVDRRDFLNVSTGERICVDLPELRNRLVIGCTSGGLIVLCDRKDIGDMHLLNPLTRQLTALPNATSLLKDSEDNNSSTWLSKWEKLRVISAGLADRSMVALHLDDREIELAVAKPNDERWSCRARPQPYWNLDTDSIMSTLSFGNRFYCVTTKGLKVVHVAAAGQQPQLVVVVEEEEGSYENHLVENDGELIRVRTTTGSIAPRYQIHRVDVELGQMVPIYDLGAC